MCISQLIIIRILNFLDSFSLYYMGWIVLKNHLTLLSLSSSVADPDPLVRGMDLDHAKIVRKTFDSYYYVTLF